MKPQKRVMGCHAHAAADECYCDRKRGRRRGHAPTASGGKEHAHASRGRFFKNETPFSARVGMAPARGAYMSVMSGSGVVAGTIRSVVEGLLCSISALARISATSFSSLAVRDLSRM